MKKVTTKNGTTLYLPSVHEINSAYSNDSGFCIACGEEAYGVEPDARNYTCECCDKSKVFGVEELMLRGIYHN